jgi:hypothetical protein
MGLLDSMFNQGGGGLLDFLRANAMNQQLGGGLPSDQAQYAPMQAMAQMPRQAQPSPLDTAQWPSEPVGAPSQGSAALPPPNAQPTQGQLPMQQPPQPQGFLDRINAGLQGVGDAFQGNGSLIGAITGNQPVNQTAQFLVSKGIDTAMAKTIASNPSLLRSVLPSLLGTGGQTDDIKEYQFAKKEDPSLTFQKFMAGKRATSGEYGMTPMFTYNEKTKQTEAWQLGKDGKPRKVELPEGSAIARGVDKIDTGTEIITINKQTGEIMSRTPKDIAGREAAEKIGQAQGTAKVALPAAEKTTTRALKMLDELETHKGFGQAVGFILGRLPALTADAADFRERVEQVDAMVFGDAVEVMRGLGALTEKEGPKVTAARARLKTAKSEEDYKTALKDIREVFRDGIENMRQKTGAGASGLPSGWSVKVN